MSFQRLQSRSLESTANEEETLEAGWTPPKLAWIEIFETGVAELDSWHRNLLRDCNDLLKAVDGNALWATVVDKTRHLVTSCIEHFQLEEAIMLQNGFPRREDHAREHRRIADQLRILADSIARADESRKEHRQLPLRFRSILIDMMVRHDSDYRSHLLHQLGR